MICPACGSEVNVCAPEPPDDDPPPPELDDPGTTTVYDPALPSVASSCVCSVSDPRRTVKVLVAYALLLPAGFAALNTPAASAPPTPAPASTTTTTTTTTQPRRRRRCPVTGNAPAAGTPPAGTPPRAGTGGPDISSTPPGAAGSGTTGPSACSRASVLLIAFRHPSYGANWSWSCAGPGHQNPGI